MKVCWPGTLLCMVQMCPGHAHYTLHRLATASFFYLIATPAYLAIHRYKHTATNVLIQTHHHEQNRNQPKELHPTKYGCVCPMRNAYSMWFHILLVRLPFYPYPILFAILDHIFSHFELPSPLCKYLHTAQTLPSTTHPYSALYFRTKG